MHRQDNTIFDAPLKIRNPAGYPDQTFWNKLFKPKESYNVFVLNEIICPTCNGNRIELFEPEKQNCIICNREKYSIVKWF
jgi:hypothetical protein